MSTNTTQQELGRIIKRFLSDLGYDPREVVKVVIHPKVDTGINIEVEHVTRNADGVAVLSTGVGARNSTDTAYYDAVWPESVTKGICDVCRSPLTMTGECLEDHT